MAYDEELAGRIRAVIARRPDLTEKKMFGGLAFLIGGNMAVSASGQGAMLLRVDPEESDRLIESGEASLAVMQGRAMPGWLRVPPEHLRTSHQLERWVERGVSFAGSLPPKR
ncbi:MAG: TfoX/Sxy family protein [Candidatus Dormiibacterota bacterium]